MKRVSAVALTMLVLAGCGGGGPLAKKQSAVDAHPDPIISMKDLAEKTGCTDTKPGTVQVYVQQAAECVVDGHDVYLYTFATTTNRKKWLTFAESAGAGGLFTHGDLWVVQTM